MKTNRPTRRIVISGIAALSVAPPAMAHRLARTETEIRILDDGTLSVIHVYHLQDAQSALFQAGLINEPDLSSLRARAKLALYTQEHFAIFANGVTAPLEIIGAEIEGDSVYIYQDGQIDAGALTIDARMLRDLIKNQSNSVNIVRGGQTISLDFSGDDGPKQVA
ncbi:MAG: DUF6702 family protein [Litorimonas sp.]